MFNTPPLPGLRLSLFGIPVHVDLTFFLFIALIMFTGGEVNPVESGILGMAIFFSLIAHEGGHALTARALGCDNIGITLRFGGGFASHSPTTRGRNLLIVLMGPAAGFALAAFAGLALAIGSLYGFKFNAGANYMLWVLVIANVVWSIFNLIPIHPMDGGQALFYTLSYWFAETSAMLFVCRLSMVLCLIVGYFAFQYQQMFVVLICLISFQSNMRIHSALNRR